MHARCTPIESKSAFRAKILWTSSRQKSHPGRRKTTTTAGRPDQSLDASEAGASCSPPAALLLIFLSWMPTSDARSIMVSADVCSFAVAAYSAAVRTQASPDCSRVRQA